MTPEVLLVAAKPRAELSEAQLWWIAIGTGIALAVAAGTLPLVSPRSRRKVGVVARIAFALVMPAAGALYVAGKTAARSGDDVIDGLHIFIVATLPLVVLRFVFARWFRRVAEAQAAGRPIETSGGKVTVVVLVGYAVIVPAVIGIFSWLPTLWA